MKESTEFEKIFKDCLQTLIEDEVYKVKNHVIRKKKEGGRSEHYNKLKKNEIIY